MSIVVISSLSAGCAGSGSASSDPNDPYEPFNRKVFALNDSLDRHVAEPAAKFYSAVMPGPARDGIHNVLANLDAPVTLANDLLQGHLNKAGQTLGRIAVNSTIGLAGFVDVASPMGIPEHTEDFGETLALYGVDAGPYLMLPLLGPSDPRDAAGTVVDMGFDPTTYIGMREKFWWSSGRALVGLVDARAQNVDQMDELRRSSVDLYATLRSLYRQHRDAEIRNGKPDLQNLPNI